MADEVLGSLAVEITGDYSDLQDSINQAQAAAETGAEKIAAAFNQEVGSGATGSITALGEAATRSATSMEGVASASSHVAAATEEADGSIGRFRFSMGNLTESFTETKSAMLELAEAYGVIKIGEFFMEQADEFEQATQRIVAATGAVGDELEQMRGEFSDVFATLPESAADVAGAMGQISTVLGDTGQQLQALTQTIGDISTITGASMESLTKSITQAFANWHVATEDQIQELTNLQAVAQAANTPLSQLLTQVSQFGPVFRDMGLSLDQAAELMGNLDVQGYNASRVIMGLQSEMNALAKQGVPDITAAMAGWVDQIKNASDDTEALSIAAQAGGRSATILVDAIRSGAINFDDFSAKLKIATSSIADQKDAAETLGQAWTEALHAIDSAMGGVLSKTSDFLKTILQSVAAVFGDPKDYIAVFFDKFEIAFLQGEQKILQDLAAHPILTTLLLGSPDTSQITAALSAVSDRIMELSVNAANAAAHIEQIQGRADSLKPSLDRMNQGFQGGAASVSQFGAAFETVIPSIEKEANDAATAILKVPASYDEFIQELNSKTINPDKLMESMDAVIAKTREWGDDTTSEGQAIIQALLDAKVRLAQFVQDNNWDHIGDLIQKMRDLGDQIDTSLNKQAVQAFDSVEHKLQELPPAFDPISQALTNLGINIKKAFTDPQADLQNFETILNSAGSSTATVDEAFKKFSSDVQQFGKDSTTAMNTLLQGQQAYLDYLQRSGASLSQINEAEVQYAETALKAAEAQGQGAENILILGENLETAKLKQDAFNDSQQGLLKLEDQVTKAFSSAWTEFGTGIGDAIAGTESFSQAWQKTITDLEKKLSELVVNFLLGQLKDAVLQNTDVLNKYHEAWNALLGIGGSSGGSSGGASTVTGATMDTLNSMPFGASGTGSGGVAGGITSIASGLSQMTSMIGLAVTAINDIVQGFQMAHLINIENRIELSTRQVAQAIDGEMLGDVHNIEIYSQQTHDWLQGVLQQYMQNINVDLDTVVGLLQTISQEAMMSGHGGGGGSPNIGVTTIPDTSGASSTLVANLADASSASVDYTQVTKGLSSAVSDTSTALAGTGDSLNNSISGTTSATTTLGATTTVTTQSMAEATGAAQNFKAAMDSATDAATVLASGFQAVTTQAGNVRGGSAETTPGQTPYDQAAAQVAAIFAMPHSPGQVWNGSAWVTEQGTVQGASFQQSTITAQESQAAVGAIGQLLQQLGVQASVSPTGSVTFSGGSTASQAQAQQAFQQALSQILQDELGQYTGPVGGASKGTGVYSYTPPAGTSIFGPNGSLLNPTTATVPGGGTSGLTINVNMAGANFSGPNVANDVANALTNQLRTTLGQLRLI